MPSIKLQSSDGEVFPVDVEIAKQSVTIKTMLEVTLASYNQNYQLSNNAISIACLTLNKKSFTNGLFENPFQDLGVDEDEEELVPLPNVNAAILKKVIQWATYHKVI